MNSKQKFKSWLDGFRKKEYTYELPDKPVYNTVELLLKMGDDISPIMSAIEQIPITNVRFGIHDYSISIVQNNHIKEKLSGMNECISFTKSSVQSFKSTGQTETEVLTTVFCLGIDNNVWKIEFGPFFLYDSMTDEFNSVIIYLCVMLVNATMKALHLDIMTKQELAIKDLWHHDILGEQEFQGKVSTYGQFKEYQIYGIDELLPDLYENDAKLYQQAIHKFPLDKTLEEESLIFDVVRKTRSERNET